MYIEQLYTACLSEAAYYIESDGEAAVIDPLRDMAVYIEKAATRGATIKYVFETHFHADFVSGHIDLAKATGAPIIFGPNTETKYPVTVAKDGQLFPLGSVEIEVLHTPGHTLESTCYLLRDETGNPHALFTGDTLFVGDVGRPDLSSGDLSSSELAALLYDSIEHKIKSLPDEVLVYPAHGPGSSCGKNLGPQTMSTIGEQKQQNYALLATDKPSFIQMVTEGLGVAPQYFPVNARINQEGYRAFEDILESGTKGWSPKAFREAMEAEPDWILIDTRPAVSFTEGFIPGAISIGLEGRFAEWAGALLPFDQPFLLITEVGKEAESVTRLARVGFDQMKGYLLGGFEAWKAADLPIDMIIDIEADEFAMDLAFDDKILVVDVRKEQEFEQGHVPGATNIPLASMADPISMASVDDAHHLYVHCAGGYRSVIAASLLKRQGFHQIRNILGGWKAIEEELKKPKEAS